MIKPAPFVTALLLAAATALATTMRAKEVACPVCEKKIVVRTINSWTGDGSDGDLAPRVAGGGAVLSYYVWTCPECLYSNWAGAFEKGVKEETKRRILAGLAPLVPVATGADQREIPPFVKYDLAARIAEWEGAPPAARGDLLMTGAWAERQEAWDAVRAVAGDESAGGRFEAAIDAAWRLGRLAATPRGEALLRTLGQREAAAAAAERVAVAARAAGRPDPLLDLVAAFLYRRLGENDAAARLLPPLEAPGTPACLREAARNLVESMARERALKERALALLLPLTRAPGGDAGDRAGLRISVADTLRRLGRGAEAAPLFLEAARDQEAPAWAVAFARHGLAKTGAAKDAEDVLDAAEARARETLRRQLLDPEHSGDAGELIGDSGDPDFLPDLLVALDHDEPGVRAAALVALHRMEEVELPPAILEALGRMALGLFEEDRNRESAMSLVRREASPASRPVFHEGLDDRSSWIREYALRGLARCGEEEDVPAIVTFLARKRGAIEDYERQAALRALSCLANREIEDAEAAAAWWATAKGRGRAAWVLDGFRAAGSEGATPLSRESVPALAALLGSDRPWVRFNAHRALRALTGKRFGWAEGTYAWNPEPLRRREEGTPNWVREWRSFLLAEGWLK